MTKATIKGTEARISSMIGVSLDECVLGVHRKQGAYEYVLAFPGDDDFKPWHLKFDTIQGVWNWLTEHEQSYCDYMQQQQAEIAEHRNDEPLPPVGSDH